MNLLKLQGARLDVFQQFNTETFGTDVEKAVMGLRLASLALSCMLHLLSLHSL